MTAIRHTEGVTDSDVPVCSARGCRNAAQWGLIWNNPKIHTPDREKVWVACDGHRAQLADFLTARDFLLRVDPLDVARPT